MKIVLGVSGGIAAYKAPDLVRRLQDLGADVRVILTPNAARFVSALALSAVSNHGVVIDQWGDPASGGVDHIALACWSDLLLIAPATANVIAKLAVGIADDALSTYALAHRSTTMVVPAMNTFMFQHPTVTANLDSLRRRGVIVLDPDSGLLACGDEGVGRMPDIPVLVDAVRSLQLRRDLEGVRVLVTAGPTREPIDPVRYLSNRSSGKMGYALAESALRRGATVTLITGPTFLSAPPGIDVVAVTTAKEMHDAVLSRLAGQQVLLKAAAVADFSPADVSVSKIKKQDHGELRLTLQPTTDILAAVSAMDPRPFVVAFAAETSNVEEYAQDKLRRKNADMIVANDVSDPSIGFDSDENRVTIIGRDGAISHVEKASKRVVADRILDRVVEALAV